MVKPYLVSSIPEHQLAELYRLMSEEIEEVAVFFMDTRGVITVWNRAAEEMKGYTAEEAIGQHLSLLYTDEDKARGWADHNLERARDEGFYKEETWRRRKDGTLFWARISLTSLRDHAGQHLGFSKITLDLTAHKMLESCVKEREETRRVLRAANAGTWTWRPDTGLVDVCENFLRLLGHHGAGTTVPFDTWIGFIHPDDRDRIRAALLEARAGLPAKGLVTQMRMCAAHAGERWFHVNGDWIRNTDGEPWQLTGVNVDIHGLKTAEAELHGAIAKLQEADLRKDEFLAMLAHELRNPLAPIRSAAEVLRRTQLGDDRLRRTSEVIARQADHMTSLVDDLLDVSRVTRGLVELTHERLDVRQIIAEAIEQVGPIVEARQQRLMVHHAAAAAVVGDKKRLVQVVANLLNNAAKFTQQGGRIEVTTESRNGQLQLSVTDDGIGMQPRTAERVFDLFAQAERTPDRSAGGLGLGLALVKSLVELHGGTVTAFSEGLGHGSTFTVCLPLVGVQAGDRAADEAPAATGDGAPPARITVVDDNADAAEMLGMLLEASGHDVLVVQSARRALEGSKQRPADIYLLDIGLPEIDGYALARALKAQPETSGSVLIAVTGYGQESDRARALAAGFSHHLVKPVNPDKLLALLEALDPVPVSNR